MRKQIGALTVSRFMADRLRVREASRQAGCKQWDPATTSASVMLPLSMSAWYWGGLTKPAFVEMKIISLPVMPDMPEMALMLLSTLRPLPTATCIQFADKPDLFLQ